MISVTNISLLIDGNPLFLSVYHYDLSVFLTITILLLDGDYNSLRLIINKLNF